MDHFMDECKKDYRMECGMLAFRQGTIYEWRFATEKEQEDTHCEFVFKSELGTNHFMSYSDVERCFGGQGQIENK